MAPATVATPRLTRTGRRRRMPTTPAVAAPAARSASPMSSVSPGSCLGGGRVTGRTRVPSPPMVIGIIRRVTAPTCDQLWRVRVWSLTKRTRRVALPGCRVTSSYIDGDQQMPVSTRATAAGAAAHGPDGGTPIPRRPC